MGNQFKNVAVIACLKTFLFVFNIIFWILATGTSVTSFACSFIFSLTKETSRSPRSYELCSVLIVARQLNGLFLLLVGLWAELDLYKYLELSPEFSGTAPHVIIGIAGLIILISSIAFSCIIKGQPVLLYIYGGFLACIFVMDAGVGASVAVYRDTFAVGLHNGLTQTLRNYDPKKANFDFAQTTLECCGVSNYTDWIHHSPQHTIPTSCCIDPNNCVTANYKDVYQKGCYEVITEYLKGNMNVLIGVAIGTAILPLLGTVLSCSLASYIKKSKYDVMN